MQFSRFFGCISCVLAISLFGCSGTPEAAAPAPTSEQGLSELSEIYKYIEYSRLRPPGKADDLNEYVDSLAAAHDRIKNGEITIVWGFGLSKSPAAAKQLLAYETKAATEGGTVLLRDGTVKQMTAAEFNAAPKARG